VETFTLNLGVVCEEYRGRSMGSWRHGQKIPGTVGKGTDGDIIWSFGQRNWSSHKHQNILYSLMNQEFKDSVLSANRRLFVASSWAEKL